MANRSASINWLHLSDWHQRGSTLDHDRKVVLDALLRDIRERAQTVDACLTELDFIVFSGDVAFFGRKEEYQVAQKHFFEPVLQAAGLSPDRLFIVPGNHDLDRDIVTEMLPPALQQPFTSNEQVKTWLDNGRKQRRVLEPFEDFTRFVSTYTKQQTPDFANVRQLKVCGKEIALLGINSAWMCGRNKETSGEVNDYGYILIGEPQIHDALKQIGDADLRLIVLHHPFDSLSEFDRNRVEERLQKSTDFILRGHQHVAQISVTKGTGGGLCDYSGGRVLQPPHRQKSALYQRLQFRAVESCRAAWHDLSAAVERPAE